MAAHRSLPSPRSEIIGRTVDRGLLRDLIDEGVPVLTVVGTGGGGKTRLATAVAHDHVAAFGDQVFFVALAGVTDAPGVAAAVAAVLEVRASADRPVEEAVCDALRHRSSLLVLDNFEQVIAAAEFVSFLTERCPLLTVLVTSRAPLHIRGERVYELERLPIGSAEAPAILLFCERAGSAQPAFVLSGDNTASVLDLCERLEGLPLAIELAASWIAMLTPAELLDRLERSRSGALGLLANGAADSPERHRTLERTITWSYDLLAPGAQALLRSLSIFEAGSTLAAVEAVCAPGAAGERSAASGETELLGHLSSLVNLHLVVVEPGMETRYRMLETTREFAAKELAKFSGPGERAVLQARHCRYFQMMAHEAQAGLESRDDGRWLAGLKADYLNMMAALSELQRGGDVQAGLAMLSALGWFWRHSGRVEEGRNRLNALYAMAEVGTLHPRIEGDSLIMIGRLSAESGLIGQGRRGADDSIAFLDRGLALHREIGEPIGLLRALESVVVGLVQHERSQRALQLCEEGLALAVEQDHVWWTSMFLYSVVIINQANGDLAAAHDAALRGRALALAHDDARLAAIGTLLNGTTLMFRGDITLAEDELIRAYDDSLAYGDKRNAAFAAVSLGPVFWVQRDIRSAAKWTALGLALAQASSEWRCIGFGLTDIVFISSFIGDSAASARFYGAIVADFSSFYRAMPPVERQRVDTLAARTRLKIGDTRFDAEMQTGMRYSRSNAIHEAIVYAENVAEHHLDATIADSHGPVPQFRATATSRGAAGLSGREIEVLVLVASGCTNRQIAEQLYLSVATVERHLVNVYRKIGVRRRTEATSYAIHHRLLD